MKKLFVVGLVLIVTGLGMWLGKTPYRNWKQKHFLAKAEDSLAKGDYRDAVLSARKTLEANPGNLPACKIMAQVTEQLRIPEAIFWRHRIVDLEPAVTQHRLDLARTALVLGSAQEADLALRGVPEADRNNAAFHELVALLAVDEHNLPAAEAQAAAAVKLDPQNKSLQINLATLDIQSKNKQIAQRARESLQALSADPAFRRQALRQLAAAAAHESDYAGAESFSGQLLAEKPVAFEDQLLNLSILKEARSKYFQPNLTYVEKQVAASPQQINALSGWLASQHLADDSLQWLTALPAKTRQERPVAVAIADAYAAGHYWGKMQSYLASDNWGNEEFLRLALLARALREQKNDLAAQASWHTAMTSASDHEQALATLARLASSWNWDKEKVEASWQLIQKYPGERWALQLLDHYYSTNGNTQGLQKIYSVVAKNDNTPIADKNNFAATSLLLRQELPRAHQIAHDDYVHLPQNPFVASTYAYSLHLQGRTQEGLGILEKLPKETLRTPSFAVYYGALLAAAGQPVKAREYLDIAAAGQTALLPEERAMIAAARQGAPVRK